MKKVVLFFIMLFIPFVIYAEACDNDGIIKSVGGSGKSISGPGIINVSNGYAIQNAV